MNDVEFIIEIDSMLSKEDILTIQTLLEKEFGIARDKVNIYKADHYAKESHFAQNIFEQIEKGIIEDMKIY
ncbi:MAG: hypothetical protein AB7D96_00025 [Arcobacteraceae bacterium]